MSENVSIDAPNGAETSTGLVKTTASTTIRRSQVRSVIRRAEREARRAGAPKIRPIRALGTVAAVGALIAGVAFPAYAAIQGDTEALTVHDVAADSAQTMVVASEVEAQPVAGSAYSATTPEELEKARAEKEAAERAKKAAAAAAAAAKAYSSGAAVASIDPANIPISAGGLSLPLPGGFRLGDSLGPGHSQATHDGLDMLIASGTPIYAIADGVIASAGWSGGYGLMVRYNSLVDGVNVEVRNAHMSAAAVSPGQTVTRGQIIGYVGSTGASSAPHLHIEIRFNGALQNPLYVLPL